MNDYIVIEDGHWHGGTYFVKASSKEEAVKLAFYVEHGKYSDEMWKWYTNPDEYIDVTWTAFAISELSDGYVSPEDLLHWED